MIRTPFLAHQEHFAVVGSTNDVVRDWLADAGVNIEMISTSEVRITCIIDEARLPAALEALHGAFELERPDAVDAVSGAGVSG